MVESGGEAAEIRLREGVLGGRNSCPLLAGKLGELNEALTAVGSAEVTVMTQEEYEKKES